MDSKKSNVLKFPKAPVRAAAANDATAEGAGGRGRVAAIAIHTLRYALFLVLYWLRGIVRGLCAFVSVVGIFTGGLAWFAFPEANNMAGSLLAVSFVAFVIMWTYDRVLLWLSPVPMMDSL